ncbi:MAG TPA: hypothetical protein VMV15_13595 [Candidatus Binataceae bacterium]|nr:hypothetical protein [Candidatus Binataceae bacterium]
MDDNDNREAPGAADRLGSPEPAHEVHRQDFELARRTHRVHILTAILILAYTTITAVQAFLLWDTYRESQRVFVASERPYVSLGNRDGRVAEFRLEPDGSSAVVIYFFNAGRTPALNLVTNLWSSRPGVKQEPQRHIERFKDPAGGVVDSVPGPVIPGQGTHSDYLPLRWTPSVDELKAIRDGKRFAIGGTFEYCDQFGHYRCQGFWARYRPPPVDDFVQYAAPSCWVPPPVPPFSEIGGKKIRMVALPRCEQPRRGQILP